LTIFRCNTSRGLCLKRTTTTRLDWQWQAFAIKPSSSIIQKIS